MRGKTLIEKIREDEYNEFKKFMRRYHNVPLFPKERIDFDLGKFFGDSLMEKDYFNETELDEFNWHYMPTGGSSYVQRRRVVKCYLTLELKKDVKAKVASVAETRRVKTMLKGDEESVKLATVIVNNWRNKRIKKEKTKKK